MVSTAAISTIPSCHTTCYSRNCQFPRTFHSATDLSPTTALHSTYHRHCSASNPCISWPGTIQASSRQANIRKWVSFYTSRSFACQSSQYRRTSSNLSNATFPNLSMVVYSILLARCVWWTSVALREYLHRLGKIRKPLSKRLPAFASQSGTVNLGIRLRTWYSLIRHR